MKKRVGIWIRVSTEEQAQGNSPKNHEERAKMYTELKKWNIVETYHLEAVSGKSVIGHSEAQRMIYDVKRGHIEGLIFSKIARLARNTKELLEFSEIFSENNADLISIEESIDTSSPSGRFFYTLIGAMAQWEREEITSRIKSSVKVRAKMGKNLGGKAPYGYEWDDHTLVINKEEAAVRRLVFDLFLENKRKKRVAAILNERGYRTRNGKKFYDTNVRRWLRDPLSKGLRKSNHTEKYDSGTRTRNKPKEEWFLHEAPAIVSEELWQKVNDILDEQESKRTKPLNRQTHLFTRYIFCSCGTRMRVTSGTKYYRCVNYEAKCGNKIERKDLEEIFHSQLTQFVVSPDAINNYLSKSHNVIDEKKQLLSSCLKKKEKLEFEIKKIIDLHLKGQIPTEAFKEYHDEPYNQLNQSKEEILQLGEEVKGLENQKEAHDYIITEAKSIYSNWNSFSKDEKRSIIETITDKIIIGTDTSIDIHLKKLLPESQLLDKKVVNGQHTVYL